MTCSCANVNNRRKMQNMKNASSLSTVQFTGSRNGRLHEANISQSIHSFIHPFAGTFQCQQAVILPRPPGEGELWRKTWNYFYMLLICNSNTETKTQCHLDYTLSHYEHICQVTKRICKKIHWQWICLMCISAAELKQRADSAFNWNNLPLTSGLQPWIFTIKVLHFKHPPDDKCSENGEPIIC